MASHKKQPVILTFLVFSFALLALVALARSAPVTDDAPSALHARAATPAAAADRPSWAGNGNSNGKGEGEDSEGSSSKGVSTGSTKGNGTGANNPNFVPPGLLRPKKTKKGKGPKPTRPATPQNNHNNNNNNNNENGNGNSPTNTPPSGPRTTRPVLPKTTALPGPQPPSPPSPLPPAPAPVPNVNARRTGDNTCRLRNPGSGILNAEDRRNGMAPYVAYNPPSADAPGFCAGSGVYGHPSGSLVYNLYNECCKCGTKAGHDSCGSGCCFDGECKPRSWCLNNGVRYYLEGNSYWKPPSYGPQGPNVGAKCDRDGFSNDCWYGCCKNGKCAPMGECPGYDPPASWSTCWYYGNPATCLKSKDRG